MLENPHIETSFTTSPPMNTIVAIDYERLEIMTDITFNLPNAITQTISNWHA